MKQMKRTGCVSVMLQTFLWEVSDLNLFWVTGYPTKALQDFEMQHSTVVTNRPYPSLSKYLYRIPFSTTMPLQLKRHN
jgi:hypothetical protein